MTSVMRSLPEAAVYRAHETALGRDVALVVSTGSSDSEPGAHFAEVARRLAGLEEAHVLPVYEVGSDDTRAFAAVCEPVGKSLDELLRDGPLAPSRAAGIAEQTTLALEALDRVSMGRLELSPAHVFVSGARDAVQISALEAALTSSGEADPGVTVARLLDAMVGADRGVLGPVLAAALRTGASPQPADLIAAARAASPPARHSRHRNLILAVIAIAVACAAVVALLVVPEAERQPAEPAVSSQTPAARLAATIPLHGTPGSLAVGESRVWVATTEGDVLRIDPATEQVVGAPIHFARADPRNNVTVRTGGGAVFALDGARGRIVRIDPHDGRITHRASLGGSVAGATVADGVVWVLRWEAGQGRRRPKEQLVRLDAASLRRVGAPVSIGRPIRIGPQAFDVEAEGGVAWVTNAFDGTVTRVNGLTGATTTTRIGGGLLDSAVRAGTLWVPDVVGGTVTPIDGRGMRPRAAPLRGDHPISVTAAGDSLWVLAQTTNIGGGGPMRLYRAAGESPAFVGQPVDVGSDLGWIAADASAVWVRSVARRAVMKYVPTSPPPASRRATPPTAATILRPGALRTGTWTTARFRAPLSFRIDLPGWLVINDGPRGLELGRYDDPRAGITIAVPPQVFDSKGGVHRLRSPRQALDALTLNRHLRLSQPRRSSFGGLAATAVTVRVRRYPKYPEFCHASCVVAFGMPTGGLVLGADIPTRIWLLRQNGQTVVVTATAGGRQAGVATSQLLDSVRFG